MKFNASSDTRLKFFSDDELKYLNEKIDKMEFSGCPVGFTDGQMEVLK